MKLYRCDLISIQNLGDNFNLRVRMLEDHAALGGRAGEITRTSRLKSIDFERKIAVTENNIYTWE